ncbi:uncharacterized protein LOC126629123 [Malus sylvestris]|uniref:uncharacterized protein LOC126629123 n=1 Tax=Malus sylvestris TaxID=3752 RepID=UPI0021AC3F23|nr:uncharacterized protein LOC126629123 [Malus sylvestris]
MPSVPTLDVPYGQGYQSPQFSANEDAWGYQGYDQPSSNMFSNACNSDWKGHSNYMWGEPQQFQQDGYWQQSEEFYLTPMQPPPHTPQQFQSNSSMSMDSDQILQVLTSLTQDQQNQDKKLDKLMSQMGEIMEFMVQIQEQSDMKDEAVPEPSKHSPNMDELLLQAEEEEDDLGSLEEFLLQAPQIPMSSNSGEEVLNSLHSNIIPPNVLCPCRFLIPNIKEGEKDIVEALPKVQSDIPILGAPKQVPDGIETFKEPCTPRKGIQENEVVEAYQEYIQEAVHETIKPKAVEFDDTGQATTIIVNLAKFKIPEMFKDVVFVIEFVSEKESKPSSPILILIYTNMFLILMIQAPTLEFKPLPNHFKYHLPLKDKFHALEPSGV